MQIRDMVPGDRKQSIQCTQYSLWAAPICTAAPPISSIPRWQRSLIPTQDALQSFQTEKTIEDASHFTRSLLHLASRKNHQPQAYLRTAHPVHFSMAMIGMDRGRHNAGMNNRT